VSIFRIAMQIVCSTQSSVRRWGPISYHYLEPHPKGLSCGYRFTSTFVRQTRMMIYRQPTQGGGPSKKLVKSASIWVSAGL
jgi:hypothetical protein